VVQLNCKITTTYVKGQEVDLTFGRERVDASNLASRGRIHIPMNSRYHEFRWSDATTSTFHQQRIYMSWAQARHHDL